MKNSTQVTKIYECRCCFLFKNASVWDFFPSLLEVMLLNAYELKDLRVELNNELIYGRIILQFYIFCNRDHDQEALISPTSDIPF